MTRYSRISALLQSLQPDYLDLLDESSKHSVPKGAESHFKLTLVSTQFIGKNRLERHRLVNDLVQAERNTGLHAFSLALYTPEEWENHGQPHITPPCHHSSSTEG